MKHVPIASENTMLQAGSQMGEMAPSNFNMTNGHNNSDLGVAAQTPDLLLALFLAGLFTAVGAFLGMARTTAQGTHPGPSSDGVRLDGDALEEYRSACALRGRSPLLLYAYLASLFVGLGALLVAFL